MESAKDIQGTTRRLLRYLKPHMWALIGIAVLLIGSTGMSLVGPYLFGYAVDTAIAGGNLPALLRISAIMLALYVLSAVMNFGYSYWITIVSQKILRSLRQDIFDHMQTLSMSFFDQNDAGDLMSRITTDVETINRVLSNGLTQILSSVLTMVGIVIAMLTLSVPLTLGMLLLLPLMVWLTSLIARRSREAFRQNQWAIGELNAVSEENIQQALDTRMEGRTSFIIAQRISSVLHADKIIVLDRGRIAGMGTHIQLLSTNPIYQEIYYSQMNTDVEQNELTDDISFSTPSALLKD